MKLQASLFGDFAYVISVCTSPNNLLPYFSEAINQRFIDTQT